MPKVIENLKENILYYAKTALLTRGYGSLSIRGVAKDCGIAVGTVYNYFSSKELLAASMMLEDWLAALESIRHGCQASETPEAALIALYKGLESFYDTYRSIFNTFTFSDNERSAFSSRHRLLVRQLADCILPVLERTDVEEAAETSLFLAENVLLCAGGSELTLDQLLHIVRRLM